MLYSTNMNELKFNAIVFLTFFILAGGVYWAVSTLDRGVSYVRVETTNPADTPTSITTTEPTTTTTTTTTTTEPTTTTVVADPQENKYQDLIDDLQKLVDAGVVMSSGSSGTRVGTVQNFLNLYHDVSKTVDNDYGPGTRELVRKFQSDHNLSADGQAGPNTYEQMIEWLESQG